MVEKIMKVKLSNPNSNENIGNLQKHKVLLKKPTNEK